MTATHKNFLKTTISAVASAGLGAFTVSTASSGYRTFGSGDDGKTFDGVTIKEGTAWEVRDGCVYTHSGTSLSRGTLQDSSTGSAIAFTSAAVVEQNPSAGFADLTQLARASVMPGGRLTLESGVPVSTTDQTAKTNVYYTPFVHNVVPLWDGYKWVPVEFTEKTLALGTLIANRPYDVFGYLSAGALTLEMNGWAASTVTMTIASPGVVSWTAHGHANGDPIMFETTGALPTGVVAGTTYYVVNKATDTFQLAAATSGTAINTTGTQSGTHTAYSQAVRASAILLQEGRLCKSGDPTRLLLGAFRTGTSTTVDFTSRKRNVFNLYNRVPYMVNFPNANNNKSYTTAAWAYWNGVAADSLSTFLNADVALVAVDIYGVGAIDVAGGRVGVGINDSFTELCSFSVSTNNFPFAGFALARTGIANLTFNYYGGPGTDFNYCYYYAKADI